MRTYIHTNVHTYTSTGTLTHTRTVPAVVYHSLQCNWNKCHKWITFPVES